MHGPWTERYYSSSAAMVDQKVTKNRQKKLTWGTAPQTERVFNSSPAMDAQVVDRDRLGEVGEQPGGRLSSGGPSGWCCPNWVGGCMQQLDIKVALGGGGRDGMESDGTRPGDGGGVCLPVDGGGGQPRGGVDDPKQVHACVKKS